MDWNDPFVVSKAYAKLRSIDPPVNAGSDAAVLPHVAFNVPADDVRRRALAGVLHLHRQGRQQFDFLPHLETALLYGDFDEETKRTLRAEIRAIERKRQQAAFATIRRLKRKKLHVQPKRRSTTRQPASFVMQVTDDSCIVRFGYRLTNVRAVRFDMPVEAEGAALLRTLTQAVEIWKDRLSLGLEADFTWRYSSEAHRVNLELLVELHLPEPEMAEEVVRGLQTIIENQQPFPEVYHFARIVERKHLKNFYGSTSFASVAEIVRHEGVMEYEGKNLYVIFPVKVDSDRLHDLMIYLRSATDGNVIDIKIRPSAVTRSEIDAALEAITIGVSYYDEDSEEIRLKMSEGANFDHQWLKALDAYRMMLSQIHSQAYEVRLRVASKTDIDILPLATLAGRSLLGLGAFDVIPAAYGARSIALDDLSPRTRAPAELSRLRRMWSLVETAFVTRLPRPSAAGIPGIPMTQVKPHRIPSGLPEEGCVLGQVTSQGETTPTLVKLPYVDRTRHVYVVGRTGTGKTTMLHNMALQDIENGHGVGVIDPHGDLIDALLERIPPHRAGDVVLFDPGDISRPVGLNLLDVEGPIAQNLAVADFIGLMYSMYDPGHTGIVGPRFEQSVRNSMYTAMAIPGATIIDVLRIISDNRYSHDVQKYLTDPIVKDYWEKIYDSQSDFHRSEVKDYITSKFSRFTSDRMVRQIIGQSKTSLNFADIFNNKKILLVNLAKGRIGEFNSQFLGFILVSQLLIAAFQRVNQAVDLRIPYYLYIDEFQNFATPGLGAMLSEGRKYGLALTLAHQFIHQLDVKIREAVFGNVGTICAFQVGLQDAEYLAREMYPVFGTDDLVNLPAYHAASKILAHKQTLMPFVMQTLPEQNQPRKEVADAIRTFSGLTYGSNAAVVEDNIRAQFALPLQKRMELLT